MSLNDPHWGRKGSEENPSNDKDEAKNPQTDRQQEVQPGKDEFRQPEQKRPQASDQEVDLEELWKQFNDRMNSLFGNKHRKISRDPTLRRT